MIRTGLDEFLDRAPAFRKRRLALIANQTCITGSLAYGWDEMARLGIGLKRIFTPEHGVFATEEDQVAVKRQPGLPLEVVSLYGATAETLVPPEEHYGDLDGIIYDVQDIGTRYYTYVNTLALVMRSLKGRDIEMIVLDRPNPLGGDAVEGPILREGYESFVGVYPVPVRHGMTAGELARFFAERERLDVKLTVLEMKGWRRGMNYPDTGLPWVPPSPNMPTLETALVYPGLCLIEGLTVSEGRGTTMPFRLCGAPFIDPFVLAVKLNGMGLEGVRFRPTYYKPNFHKHAGNILGGIYIHITSAERFRPFCTGVAVVKTLFDLYPDRMEFILGYEFNDRHPAFDILTGSSTVREMILAGCGIEEIEGSWIAEQEEFILEKEEYHLYGS